MKTLGIALVFWILAVASGLYYRNFKALGSEWFNPFDDYPEPEWFASLSIPARLGVLYALCVALVLLGKLLGLF